MIHTGEFFVHARKFFNINSNFWPIVGPQAVPSINFNDSVLLKNFFFPLFDHIFFGISFVHRSLDTLPRDESTIRSQNPLNKSWRGRDLFTNISSIYLILHSFFTVFFPSSSLLRWGKKNQLTVTLVNNWFPISFEHRNSSRLQLEGFLCYFHNSWRWMGVYPWEINYYGIIRRKYDFSSAFTAVEIIINYFDNPPPPRKLLFFIPHELIQIISRKILTLKVLH